MALLSPACLSYCVAGREVKDNEVTDDGSQSELYVKMEKIDEKSENDKCSWAYI